MFTSLHFPDVTAHATPPELTQQIDLAGVPSPRLWAGRWHEQGRFGGVFVQDADTVLGLRGWEDAYEGLLADGAPWVMFELEKIFRMLLAGSGLAFEMLASWASSDPPENHGALLLHWGLNNRIFDHYLSVVPKEWDEASSTTPKELLRQALTGATLATSCVSLSFPTLAQMVDPSWEDPLVTWQTSGKRLDPTLGQLILNRCRELMANAQKIWSSRPNGYDEANRFLVTSRQLASSNPPDPHV